jgi:hypothetical protein
MKPIFRLAAYTVATAAALCLLTSAAAAQNYQRPSPKITATPSPEASISTTPPTAPAGQTPGESNPATAPIAALSIAITGAAGIFIYRAIKKGL